MQLCIFSTIHFYGLILGSFESQETGLLFWRPKMATCASVATRQGARPPTTPEPLLAAPRPKWVEKKKEMVFFPSFTKFWLGVATFLFLWHCMNLTLSRRKRSVFLKNNNSRVSLRRLAPQGTANVKVAFETTFSCNKFSLVLEKSNFKF